MDDGFNHSIQMFAVQERVRVKNYLTGPVENCLVTEVSATPGGWFYLVESMSGDRRWLQGDELEAI
jgi:hypothetical protein